MDNTHICEASKKIVLEQAAMQPTIETRLIRNNLIPSHHKNSII